MLSSTDVLHLAKVVLSFMIIIIIIIIIVIIIIVIIIIVVFVVVIIFHGLHSVWHKSFYVADVALSLLECFQMTEYLMLAGQSQQTYIHVT